MDNHDYSNTPVDNSQVPRQDSFAGKNPQYITQPPNGQGQRPDTEPAYHSRYPQSWQPPYSPYYWRDFPQYGYYHYPYGAYPRPAVPATPRRKEPGIGIASLVASIAAFLLVFMPVLNFILALLALVLGIVGMKRGGGFAIAGTVIGAISLITALSVSSLYLLFWLFIEEGAEYGPSVYDWYVEYLSLIGKL